MWYMVSINQADFAFHKKYEEEIVKRIKNLSNQIRLRRIHKPDVEAANDVYELFRAVRYSIYPNGDYLELECFLGESYGDEQVIFNEIADLLEPESYIEYIGEDGELFRLVIKDGKCLEIYPEIIWKY